MPQLLGNNYSVYGIIDQPLFQPEGSKTGSPKMARPPIQWDELS